MKNFKRICIAAALTLTVAWICLPQDTQAVE